MASCDLGSPPRVRRAWCTSAVMGWLMTASPGLAGADDVAGEWRTPTATQVQIRPCGDSVCGRIVRIPDASIKDIQNPEARLRPRPVLGIEIFTGTRRTPNGWKGHMYVPESGHTYVSRIINLERGQLQVSYCGPLGFFCTREVWTRTR
jgi:uncharacterized protein (DUF2147 family)